MIDLADRRLIVMVLATYAVLRVFSAILIEVVAAHQDPAGVPNGPANGATTSYWDVVRTWDGEWYRKIAETGYPREVPRNELGVVQQNPWAFYPLYPMLTRVLMAVTGGSFAVVGSLFALACGAVAAVLMAILLRPRIGAAAAWCATALLFASPPSPVFQMTYTESLALALLFAFLIAIEREWWEWAGLIAIALGLARPVAVPLGVVALVACLMRWRARRERPLDGWEISQLGIMLTATAASAGIWPAIAWASTGERSAYTETMASWRGTGKVVPFKPWIDNFHLLFGGVALPMLLLFVIGYAVLFAGPWASALGGPMRAWCLAYGFYLLAVLDVWTSVYRYLVFVFPVAVVLIGAGWKRPERRVLVGIRTAVWLVLFLGWQWWWCAELLLIHPPSDYPI
ncbi:hypothetical protein [Calidifontibacter terrae]